MAKRGNDLRRHDCVFRRIAISTEIDCSTFGYERMKPMQSASTRLPNRKPWSVVCPKGRGGISAIRLPIHAYVPAYGHTCGLF